MKRIFAALIVFIPYTIYSQDGSGKDSDAFLDSIFNEMDEVLGHMLQPKSFVSASIGAGTGFYNFKSANTTRITTEKKLLFSPSVSYLHKSGLGISGNSYVVNDGEKLNAYQFSVSPSYDFIKRGRFSAGIAYTHYFTKKELPFYTTPLQNEAFTYFNYRKLKFQPGIAVIYGWGSRTKLEEQRLPLLRMRQKRNPAIITIRNDESVRDFSMLFSVRRNFMWARIFQKKDLFTLTPILLVSAGTQSFGFNTSFQSNSKFVSNFLPNNQYVKANSAFDAQSATFVVRADYSLGILFFQSQFLVDHYLHNAEKKTNNAVSFVAGINF